MSKNRPDAGTFDIPIQRAIFGQRSVRSEFLTSRAASTGSLRECRFLDDDLHFLDSHLCDLCFGIEIRASKGSDGLDSRLNGPEAPVEKSRGFLYLTERPTPNKLIVSGARIASLNPVALGASSSS